MERCNPILVQLGLDTENTDTCGNYHPTELFGIECFSIPPYSLVVDNDKVPEINLEAPDKDRLFYMDFNYEQ